MSARERLDEILKKMSEERLREIANFAAFLSWQDEQEEWRQFGKSQFARAYGANEPEYTAADLKQERGS